MTWTLDKAGYDVTYVRRDGQLVGMVQPDTYNPGSGMWTSWLPNRNVWDANDWDYDRHHTTRDRALAAVGWIEVAA